jgi:prevent-host-death family protein
MARWQTGDAGQRLTDLVEAVRTDGPQVVMRGVEPVAVLLSPEEYRRLVRQAAFGDGVEGKAPDGE